jgi:hypothetical protein
MIANPFVRHVHWLVAIAGIGISIASAQTTIYSDNFDGDTGDIDTLAPDVRPGTETWTASPVFNADGSVDRASSGTSGRGSMTLPFTPVDGFIYTLDASFTGVTGDTDWLALGFARGQSAGTSSATRFDAPSGSTVSGTTWMLFRGATPAPLETNSHKIQGGLGATSPGNWLDTTLGDLEGGNIDLRIVLDTTGGTAAWTATWYAKLPADASYTLVGATTTVPHDPSRFTSVGISASNTNTASQPGTGGTIESFSLTAEGTPALPKITDLEIDVSGDVILTLDGPTDGLTVQQSDNLSGFADIPSTADGNTLTIDAADVDPDADGKDFYRVRD